MDKRKDYGQRGEEIAARYLKSQGYRILARNFRYGRAEIDLVCRKGNWLVFAEVKSRSSLSFGYPETHVSEQQAGRIMDAACMFAEQRGLNALIRYDVISIVWEGRGYSLAHFEDAFG